MSEEEKLVATRYDVVDRISELTHLMREFRDDRTEQLRLVSRMRIRLNQLEAHCVAGRPDLKASLRDAA